MRLARACPSFADQLYDLRGHIDLVRQRLAARPQPDTAASP
jgi:hypothetical protein